MSSEECTAFSGIKPKYRRGVPPHEPAAGQQRADRAAAIFDDDPDPSVVEDEVARTSSSAEEHA